MNPTDPARLREGIEKAERLDVSLLRRFIEDSGYEVVTMSDGGPSAVPMETESVLAALEDLVQLANDYPALALTIEAVRELADQLDADRGELLGEEGRLVLQAVSQRLQVALAAGSAAVEAPDASLRETMRAHGMSSKPPILIEDATPDASRTGAETEEE